MVSPLLLNIALQGMEEAAGVRYDSRGYVKPGCPTVITYADDFVALCHSREQAQDVTVRLGAWLKTRGLSLNPDKTRITRVADGFDFLAFTIRRHQARGRTKTLTTPSRDAMKRIRRRNAAELRPTRCQPGRGDPDHESDHQGTGELLPIRSVQKGLPSPGPSPVAAAVPMGPSQASPEESNMGHRPILRSVLSHQKRPVGLRRPRKRRLAPPLHLDKDRPARPGHR